MRHLLNTLFVLTEDTYLSLDGENAVVERGGEELGRFPLHTLETILYFGYRGASPALMGACASRGISLCFYRPSGRFLARVCGEVRGNVLLRRRQYELSGDEGESNLIARNFVLGKVYNARWILERCIRDHGLRVDVEALKSASSALFGTLPLIAECPTLERLRGLEGEAAMRYFSVFDELILQRKESFFFRGRSRRPPMDRVNALLSFCYALLAGDCAAALEGAGLDAYMGFLHRDRPGRTSLAQDLMEELRGVVADRFALSMINGRLIAPEDFAQREDGAWLLEDGGRRKVLQAWQKRKQETISHPFLKEKVPWGLVPHLQALLLARALRGDLDGYPPFFWK